MFKNKTSIRIKITSNNRTCNSNKLLKVNFSSNKYTCIRYGECSCVNLFDVDDFRVNNGEWGTYKKVALIVMGALIGKGAVIDTFEGIRLFGRGLLLEGGR